MEQHQNRVMFWHGEDLKGKFYDLPHIPRIGEGIFLKGGQYRVIDVLFTPEQDDASDLDIYLESVESF
ncbi:hypothetical protein HW132_28245 [Brasilonema sp. CT11]|nr:hypothetical protein [Brasilonema sp. CT11]